MATIADIVSATAGPSAAQNITNCTTCLLLSFGSIGVERKVSKGQIKEKGTDDGVIEDAPVEIDADKDLVRVSKKLIVSAEYDAIRNKRRDFRRQLEKLSVPSLFKEGIYRVKYTAVPKVSQMLHDFVPQDQDRVKKFLAVYKERCDETLEKLKALGETTEYPPVSKVEAAFYVEYHWLTFATDEKLKQEVGEEFFLEAQKAFAGKVEQATEAIIIKKRKEAQELFDHLVDVLTPNADGTKKRFQASTVTNVKEFLENFQYTDGVGDSQLGLIVKAATKLLDGVDADGIRKNEAVSGNALKGMSMVKNCLDNLVVEAGTRKIVFAPEPEPPASGPAAEELDDAFAEVG